MYSVNSKERSKKSNPSSQSGGARGESWSPLTKNAWWLVKFETQGFTLGFQTFDWNFWFYPYDFSSDQAVTLSMTQELEIKFLGIDPDALRVRLEWLGASCLHDSFLMQRCTFHLHATQRCEWFRIRREFGKVTMTYKCHHTETIDGLEESEVDISDFALGVEILEKTWLRKTSYQENFREMWVLDDVEICIDTWPWIPPYVEIEWPNPDAIRHGAEKLGFSLEDAFYGGTEVLYEKYLSIPKEVLIQYPHITFDTPPQRQESLT